MVLETNLEAYKKADKENRKTKRKRNKIHKELNNSI